MFCSLDDVLLPLESAYTVGITGSPGAGKSTLAARSSPTPAEHDEEVAVLAIDRSSPFSRRRYT